MTAYYNEFDKGAAAWLRELIRRDLIAPGDVDERSIEDVRPDDLRGYAQHHFFAGIGGWSYALRLAGWPDDQPVWTGSCPCQPFSSAGARAGFDDQRHLWPAFFHLIRECRPAIVFGEQVASKAADAWIDLVHADLEGMGYAFGGVAFPSAGVGAPHIRDRTYWLGVGQADSQRTGLEGHGRPVAIDGAAGRKVAARYGAARGDVVRLADADGRNARAEREQSSGQHGQQSANGFDVYRPYASTPHGFWRDADWLGCRDGKWRPVEPRTFPLAHGIPARMVRLRGYGNAINPHQAAEFIAAAVEAMSGQDFAEAAA